MNTPTLESMCIAEKIENNYAEQIAKEDMKEDYGKEVVL